MASPIHEGAMTNIGLGVAGLANTARCEYKKGSTLRVYHR